MNFEPIDTLKVLKAARVAIKAGDIPHPEYGLCWVLNQTAQAMQPECKTQWDMRLAQSLRHRFMTHVADHMTRWPDGSGVYRYPIPSSYKHIDATAQYDSTHNKWGGKQLKYRLALLDWLIEQHGG